MSVVSLIDNDDVAKKRPVFYTAKNLHPLMVKCLKKKMNESKSMNTGFALSLL